MRRGGLLDLDNHKGKASGGYCTDYPVSGRPFIFMNGAGLQEDVQTLIHEGGHAFHVFESNNLPYVQQKRVGLEFTERHNNLDYGSFGMLQVMTSVA